MMNEDRREREAWIFQQRHFRSLGYGGEARGYERIHREFSGMFPGQAIRFFWQEGSFYKGFIIGAQFVMEDTFAKLEELEELEKIDKHREMFTVPDVGRG